MEDTSNTESLMPQTNAVPPTHPDGVNVDHMQKHQRYPDVYTEFRPNSVLEMRQVNLDFHFQCNNGVSLWLQVLETGLLRFRYCPTPVFPKDFSYAIAPDFQRQEVALQIEETEDRYQIQTSLLRCKIAKADLSVRIENLEGQVLSEDEAGYYAKSTILKGFNELSLSKKTVEGEIFLGLGDKSSASNLRGKRFVNWNTDAFSYGAQTDPLYRTIPFYYGIREGQTYGIFLDNSYKTHFDFAHSAPEVTRFWAEGGELNYYFLYGQDSIEVAQTYLRLTGRPELPPFWALGFHQCRWSYYPEERVRELAQEFRDRQIPCDAIYLDIDYMDGYRCFTWDTGHFPNPTQLVQDLRQDGFKTIVMIDPGIRVDEEYFVFKEGKAQDFFCRRADGDLMVGPVWPPACVFPDFTRDDVRQWWGQLYQTLYLENGISGFWNDMNEPAVFGVDSKTFPDDIRHHYEGRPTSHRPVHNVYGMQMTRATYNGLKQLKDQHRPFVLTRATYSGGQRYASVWTGDNVASWEHLQIANIQCQRLSISGFSFVGSDVGGFAGVPDGELMVRWLQLGAYHPFYRVHSMGNNEDGGAIIDSIFVKEREANNRLDQEPWVYGEPYTTLAKQAIEWRYQLLPYLYTAIWQNCQEGTPVLRPLPFVYPEDARLQQQERDFMLGEHLLISPIVKPGQTQQEVDLPEGLWYHLASGKTFAGGARHSFEFSLADQLLFAKAGTVLPLYPVRQYTSEAPIEQLQLRLYFKEGQTESQLYEDQGEGYAYQAQG
ncbi:MAG: TIM-barrel domain-containing protein, partial [Bacteroidota bacterium]